MDVILNIVMKVVAKNGLINAFVIVGMITWLSYAASKYLTKGRIHGSAIAIVAGLILAYVGGIATGGKKGIADVTVITSYSIHYTKLYEAPRRPARGPR